MTSGTSWLAQRRWTQALTQAITIQDPVALRQVLTQGGTIPATLVALAAQQAQPDLLPLMVAHTSWRVQGEALMKLLDVGLGEARQRLLTLTDTPAHRFFLTRVVTHDAVEALHQLVAHAPTLLLKDGSKRLIEAANAGAWGMFEALVPLLPSQAVQAATRQAFVAMARSPMSPDRLLLAALLETTDPSPDTPAQFIALAQGGKLDLVQRVLDRKHVNDTTRAQATVWAARADQWSVVDHLAPLARAEDILAFLEESQQLSPALEVTFLTLVDRIGCRLRVADQAVWLDHFHQGLPQTAAAMRQAQTEPGPTQASPRRRFRA